MPRGFSEGFLKPKKDGAGKFPLVRLASGTYSNVIARNSVDVQIPINPGFTPTQVFLTFLVDVSPRAVSNNVGQLFTYVGVISMGNIASRVSYPANGSSAGGHTYGTTFEITSFTDTVINVRFNTNLDNVYPVSGTWVAIGTIV